MKTVLVLLLTISILGCGYSKNNSSGKVAASAPTISELVPDNANMGGPGFTLTVNGSNFVNGAVVYWNSSPRTTTFATAGQVTANISAADIATAGIVHVFVKNPGGTGIYMNQPGQNSNTVDFTVNP